MDGPLHGRIASDLRRRIASQELPLGAPVPSESQLCEQWNASRGPVRQALATLRAEGLIGGGRGKPPVVRSQVAPQPFETFWSFSRWAEELGRTPGQRTLEVARRPASPEAADALELEEGEPVVQLLRLRLLDGVPAMIERTTFVWPVGHLLFDFDCDSGSIYAYLSGQGVDLSMARHVIDAVAADSTDASLLTTPQGTPLLRERRRTRSLTGEALEYSDDRYRPDVVSFTIENSQQSHPALLRSPN
ncbi:MULTISPECIES: GntR family transcriptional regulator [Streptomyces]|uniref:GntR family transcriptional regulator n=1 Tax=Streptomyces koelreuteriae TaxID=2838015 RepID=A0ABX8G129_9ACTN|nr:MULTISPECIES: GntR family transcriptional regulator [Streptomyces]QWB27233.1 GntR family transcriptional regulator [Streptomyces koelreuteriae]UUA10317.1 GntR family transcriptional regulator [Streptomyces koelreuteriae]UUA17924.1 GntR family transcriptional regulator [Streptomyces sp. CRCS-T-1]